MPIKRDYERRRVMTVGELIRALKKYPEDMDVMFDMEQSRDLHFDEKVDEVDIHSLIEYQGIVFLEEGV